MANLCWLRKLAWKGEDELSELTWNRGMEKVDKLTWEEEGSQNPSRAL